jgi:hypothetical protein
LTKIDFVGNQVNLLHKEQKRIKSSIGGTFTLIIAAFTVFCSVYYGEDLVYKKKPISRFSKEYNPTSIAIQDLPHSFIYNDINGVILTDMDKYIDIIPRIFETSYDNKTKIAKATAITLNTEKCTEESFGKYQSLFTDPKYAVPYKQSYCINNTMYKMTNGTVVENANISIINEYGAVPGRFLVHAFKPCKNTTADKVCATPEEIEERLNVPIYIDIFMLDYFVDLNDLDNPMTPFITSYMISIMKGFTKLAIVKFKSSFINTDTGYLLESVDDIKSFSQIDLIRNDVSKVDDNLVSLYFDANKINDVYYRRYVKIQDLLASIGGLIKLLFTVSSLMNMYFSYNKLLLEIGVNTFKLNKEIVLLETKSNKIVNYSLDKSNLHNESKNPNPDESFGVKKINNFVSSKHDSSEKIEMSSNDIIRVVFKCKARYTKGQYNLMKIAVMNNLEITNIIRSNLMIEKINQTLFQDDDARELMICKMNEKMQISNDRDCKLLLKSLSRSLLTEEINYGEIAN